MALSLDQITEALAADTRPGGPDGCSNHDRILFVAQVFETDLIDLSLEYDFTPVLKTDDPLHVEAAKHLALLKIDYYNRMFDNFYMTDGEHAESVSPLILAVQRMNWHLHYLDQGVPTPPFPAFH